MRNDRSMLSLSHFSIRRKLLLLVSLSLFSILISTALAALLHRNDLIDARKNEIRSIVELAAGPVAELHSLYTDSRLSRDELILQVRKQLDISRYRQGNYLFLIDTAFGTMISNAGRPELEGQDIKTLKDSQGVGLLSDLLTQLDNRNGTFWRYHWAESDGMGHLGLESSKISYVMRVPGSDWVLGSGVHVQDIDQQLIERLLTLAIVMLTLLLLTLAVALIIAHNISSPITQLCQAARRLGEGQLEGEVRGIERRDELGTLARAIALLQSQAQDNLRLRKLSDHARFLEEFDPVTRLYNRQALGEALEREISRQQRHDCRLAVLVIRLVLLREITTRWGRECSNRVLNLIVERLREHLRVDDVLARHGEDTLTLVRPEAGDDDKVRALLRELLETIALPVSIDGQPFSLHGRIGVSLYPGDGDQEFQLIGRAEEALRGARREERDWVWFNSLTTTAVDQRLTLWQDIQVALEENQFFLAFQPIYNLSSNQPVSAEVLLRWRHPQQGLISPAVFIPFAEQTGLVKRIDLWVLNAVARQLRQWSKQGLSMPRLALNLSGISFLRPDFELMLNNAFSEDFALLKHLEFELTEGVLIEDMERIQDRIDSIRQLGVQIAIDDFGTGYSSLSRIRNLAIDHIKIDRSFIDDIESSPQSCKIIEAILHLAHGLRLKVVAEGVETEAQLHELRQMGCDLVQGYLLSRPLERADYEALLNEDLEIDADIL
ncbi:diguanylate cyclase [Marinobacterium lacunae]|uniref:Diguanylate cyclase n=1 Tax=Marinobacterium lacunae TaxID=1232683 RepID=A0A081G321_9GAMM|nr:EAL domain-containing protein [Marinobacterium lacunae]KEA65176.1 diguanylate cyclase [Marinobacterium lacunae]